MPKYLCAYTTIFKNNVRASYFTTVYVDAFAGTGHRVETATRLAKAAAATCGLRGRWPVRLDIVASRLLANLSDMFAKRAKATHLR